MSLNSIEGKTFWLLGDTMTIKITGKQTQGQYSAWEIAALSQRGPPPHFHNELDEGFYVLEGEFSFKLGDRTVEAKPGSFIHVPKKIVHEYMKHRHR